MKNKLCYLILFMIVFAISSCNNEDSYTPLIASSQSCGVLLSYSDNNANTLLSNEDILSSISIYGNESKKEIKYRIKKIDGQIYLSFDADLPDVRHSRFNADKRQATASTVTSLKIQQQEIKLVCTFKYQCTSNEEFGNNSITIEKIEYNNHIINRNEQNTIGSDIVLHFISSPTEPILK